MTLMTVEGTNVCNIHCKCDFLEALGLKKVNWRNNWINDYLIPSTRTPNTDDRELKVMTVMDATQHEPGVTEETSKEKEVYLEYDDSWWLEENNGEQCLEKIDGIGDLFVA